MSADVARAEWRRANESLTAALLCLDNGLNADAISRAYYAVMHAAKAALEIRDVSTDSHQGVRNQFGMHIVRLGLIEPVWGSEIGRLNIIRVVADYDVMETFTESDARDAYGSAEAFMNRIQPLVGSNG